LVIKVVTGTVKWYNSRKGYGFIISEEGKDIFVHYSALVGDEDDYLTLHENDEVEFEIVQGQKGPQASEVVVTKHAPTQQSRINRFETSGGKRGGGYKKGGRRGSAKEMEWPRSTKF
jgi:CspA family cold shock protein